MFVDSSDPNRTDPSPLGDPLLVGLVVAARDGDDDAFARLMRRYEPTVEGVIRAETRDRHDVADLVQETFLRAWRQLLGLRDPERFRSWLLQIARRVVIDHHRRAAARPRARADSAELLDVHVAEQPGPAELADAADLRERMRVAVAQLPSREGVALRLAASGELTTAQLADELEVSAANAKVILHRARSRLRGLVA